MAQGERTEASEHEVLGRAAVIPGAWLGLGRAVFEEPLFKLMQMPNRSIVALWSAVVHLNFLVQVEMDCVPVIAEAIESLPERFTQNSFAVHDVQNTLELGIWLHPLPLQG